MNHTIPFLLGNFGRRLLRLAGLVALVGFATLLTARAAEALKAFNVPVGPAETSLKQFSEQAGCGVLFVTAAVQGVKTAAVQGELSPRAALELMLKDTGLVAVQDEKTGALAVKRAAPADTEKNAGGRSASDAAAETGSITGAVALGGEAVEGARVSVAGLRAFTLTDSMGYFRLDDLPAGPQTLVIQGEHIARTRVTGVMVKADRSVTLNTIMAPPRTQDLMGEGDYIVAAEKLSEVLQLERVEVSDRKPQPYVGANVDLPRTESDAQPYYIYDSAQIERSGATSVVDFFQKFVPMNYRKGSAEQYPTALNGASSTFSLFGPVGQAQTLLLVNGRMQANVVLGGTTQQPDVNGIPISAIDHIEVLPASASAIYGGGALGGVINIVLKQNYVGGDLRLTYENVAGADAPAKSATLTGGLTLEDGKTHVFFSASYSERAPLLLQDRPFLVDYLRRWETAIYGDDDPGSPLLGSTPNITTGDPSDLLTLKSAYGGATLGSAITYVPAGYRGVATSGVAGLVANAGHYNTTFSDTTASPIYNGFGGGLRTPLVQGMRLRGFSSSVRRMMLPNLEWYANLDYRSNQSYSNFSSNDGVTFDLPASAPTSPFTDDVYLNVPISNTYKGFASQSTTRDVVTGFKFDLPHEWTALAEIHFAESNFNYSQWTVDSDRVSDDIASGAFDILRDLVGLGVDLSAYRGQLVSRNTTTLSEFTTRASGPVWQLPAGPLRATAILGTREQGSRTGVSNIDYVNYANDFSHSIILPRTLTDNSAAVEFNVPVFGRQFVFPLLQSLEVQIAGRYDDYRSHQSSYAGDFTSTVTTRAISASDSHYNSENQTYGLTWKPVRDVMFRAAYSTAFTPPDFSNLLPSTSTPGTTTIIDPLRGNTRYSVSFLGGNNPDLKPETSEGGTFGVILTPRWVPGLRLSVDYSDLTRDNSVGTLSAQSLVGYESYFPGRITRAPVASGDTYNVGKITFVDTRSLNLLRTESQSYNFRADYSLRTLGSGNWSFSGGASVLEHFRVQPNFGAPLTEMIGNENQSSYLIPKFQGNGSITWDKGPWSLGWTTRYYASYLEWQPYQVYQGSRYVPAQAYHDIFAAYRFRTRRADGTLGHAWLDNSSVEFGVKNVFNTKPPFDAVASSGLPYSPYGDLRLASFWLSFKKEF